MRRPNSWICSIVDMAGLGLIAVSLSGLRGGVQCDYAAAMPGDPVLGTAKDAVADPSQMG
jgi:hypothetical protein